MRRVHERLKSETEEAHRNTIEGKFEWQACNLSYEATGRLRGIRKLATRETDKIFILFILAWGLKKLQNP